MRIASEPFLAMPNHVNAGEEDRDQADAEEHAQRDGDVA